MISRLSAYLSLLLLVTVASGSPQIPPDLAQLQNDFAMRYLEPEPHMALAKYYLDHGDRREAFFVLEGARRGTLEEAVFDRAFQAAFGGFDTSKAAEEKLLADLARNPHSADIQFKLADIYISRSEYGKANEILLRALKEYPEDFRFTAGLSGVLSLQGKSDEADRMVNDYARKYPESANGYALRADKLHETAPQSVKQLLEQGLAKYPNDGYLNFKLATVLQEAGNLDGAEAAFVKAAGLDPKSVDIQSWVGRFFFKVRKNSARALPYYLNAYFLSPHAYESEFVESRVRDIYFVQSHTDFEKQLNAKKPLIDLLKDQDPTVVEMTLEQMEKEWQPGYIDPVTALMGHEDQGVRWAAAQLLKKKVDSSFDAKLRTLLQDNDLRKRGLAAYIAVYRWKNGSFGSMDELLGKDAELVRFDAISALIMEGGESGRQHALAHAAKETNPVLKKLLNSERAK